MIDMRAYYEMAKPLKVVFLLDIFQLEKRSGLLHPGLLSTNLTSMFRYYCLWKSLVAKNLELLRAFWPPQLIGLRIGISFWNSENLSPAGMHYWLGIIWGQIPPPAYFRLNEHLIGRWLHGLFRNSDHRNDHFVSFSKLRHGPCCLWSIDTRFLCLTQNWWFCMWGEDPDFYLLSI